MIDVFQILSMILNPEVVFAIVIASLYGLFIGTIPGLTATMATALLVPFTFWLPPLPGLAMIITMSALAIFAGDIPATLIRIPGTPASAAFTQDSYELAKQGKAGVVLGIDLVIGGVLSGLFGVLMLILFAPPLAEFASSFTSIEYFWLCAFGLSTAVAVSTGSPIKGALSLLLGIFLASIGLDETYGFARFTFGNVELLGGVSFIPAMIGIFGIPEIIRQVSGEKVYESIAETRVEHVFKDVFSILRKYKVNFVRSSLIGVLIGALPGAGADIAAWVAYGVSKQFSKEKGKFGRGSIEAVVDAGSANNSSLAGTWIPTLVFGIPGDSITAIVLGVLMMKGLRPGPLIFQQQADLIYALFAIFILANIIMLPFGYLAIRLSSLLLKVPRNILMPAILVFCIIGSYAINNSLFDVALMLILGIIAYFMEQDGFPTAPMVLGIVLQPILERQFMMSIIKTRGEIVPFFTRPIAAVLSILTILAWLLPLVSYMREKSKNKI